MKTNISSLYQTAKIEITRKDRTITELRTELEDLKFRRVGKRKWEQPSDFNRPAKVRKTETHDQPQSSHCEFGSSNKEECNWQGDLNDKDLQQEEIVTTLERYLFLSVNNNNNF